LCCGNKRVFWYRVRIEFFRNLLDVEKVVAEWLKSRERANRISRNTIAVGIVVLDHLRRQCPITPDDLFSKGGELKGSRSGLQDTLERYGISRKFLKEATTRQAHQDARALAKKLGYGKELALLDEESRKQQLQKGTALLVDSAHTWLGRQPIKVSCDRHQSPASWVASILEKAKGKSGGVVEQHLVGAKLQQRHPGIAIPNNPGHAADAQTGRSGDFPLNNISYHVTATDGKEATERCKQNIEAGVHPVLLVPRRFLENARVRADVAGIQHGVSVLAIEDFIAQNIIEMSTSQQTDFFSTLKAIIDEYNRRLEQVETDMSLKIEVF
jgi:hypothetical protein